jgi:hypothetical protein
MTRHSRACPNRRIEAVDVDRDVIALAGRDPFKQPVALTSLRREGLTRTLSSREVERLFALGFALEQFQEHVRDLARCIEEWVQILMRRTWRRPIAPGWSSQPPRARGADHCDSGRPYARDGRSRYSSSARKPKEIVADFVQPVPAINAWFAAVKVVDGRALSSYLDAICI